MAIELTSGIRLGEPAPEWTLPTIEGGQLSLHALRGQKTLLFFWGSW